MDQQYSTTFSTFLPRLFIALLLLVVATELSAQREWEHLQEPFAGIVYPPVEIDGGVVAFVGGGAGVQVSRDDGKTWDQYGANSLGVIPFGYVNGEVLAFSGVRRGLFRILNEGDSLVRADAGLTGRVVWARTGPNDSSWVMTEDGLFISGDGAMNWRKLPHDFGAVQNAQSFGLNESQVLVVSNNRAWYSSDMGETFVSLNDRLTVPPVNGTILENGDLLIGTSFGYFRSSDGGMTFSFFSISRQLPLVYGAIGEAANGDLWTGTWNGNIYRISADGLLTRRYPLPASYVFSTRVLRSGTVLLADFGTGIWRMEGGGETFEHVGMPYTTRPNEIKRGPDGEMMIQLNTGVAVSPDDGMTWQYRYAGMESQTQGYYEALHAYHPLDDGTIVGFGVQGSVVRWDRDGASVVDEDRLGIPMGGAAVQTATGTLVVADTGGAFRTTDRGETWAVVDHRSLSMTVAGDNSIWSAAGNLYVSRDDGVSFTTAASPLDTVTTIYPAPGGALYLIGRDIDGEAHYLSTDNGASWTEVTMPCAGTAYTSIENMGGRPGLGAITDCGVQFWDPENNRWKLTIISLPEDERGFTSLYHSNEHLIAGGIGGLYRSPDVILSVTEEDNPAEIEDLDLSWRETDTVDTQPHTRQR